MGRSYTPEYRVEYRDNMLASRRSQGNAIGHNGAPCHSQSWNTKAYGRPSYDALCKWRDSMNSSFMASGVNAHVSRDYGFTVHIHTCAIVRQSDGALMFKYDAPMFELI